MRDATSTTILQHFYNKLWVVSYYWFNLPLKICCKNVVKLLQTYHFPQQYRQNRWQLFSFNNYPQIKEGGLCVGNNYYLEVSILLFKGFLLLGFHIFQFKNAPTPLCLSRDKIKGHSGKNTTLTLTKTLPKKQDYFPVIFQITLSTYKLNSLK